MEIRDVVTFLLYGVVALMGILYQSLRSDVSDLKRKVDEIPETYHRRDEAHKQFDTVVMMLQRIEDKIDKKADKR